MKKDSLILYTLSLSTVSACVINIVMRNKAAYERGRLDQLRQDASKLEQLSNKLESLY